MIEEDSALRNSDHNLDSTFASLNAISTVKLA